MNAFFYSNLRLFAVCSLFASSLGAQTVANPYAESKRFVRGSGTNPSYQTFVAPLNFQKGVALAPTGANADKFGNKPMAELPWFSRIAKQTSYLVAVSGASPSQTASYNLAVENPVVAFGSLGGGTPLYAGQSYSFILYSGGQFGHNGFPNFNENDLLVSAYEKSVFSSGALEVQPAFQAPFSLPRKGTVAWTDFIKKGGQQEIVCGEGTSVNGKPLNCKITIQYIEGNSVSETLGIQPTAFTDFTPNALIVTVNVPTGDFCWKFSYLGATSINGTTAKWMTVADPQNPDSSGEYNPGFVVDFEDRPAWRSIFIDRPHFDGQPLPPLYQGRSYAELSQVGGPVTKQFAAPGASYGMLDNSPELRRHPILDQMVDDLGNDPLALANYVVNEIELTDALSYNDDGSVSEQSLNMGGVNRGALATYLEAQGSPAEQCALLVYLLRESGTPACYVFPPNNGLKMLDARMSKILRMQLKGAVDYNGNSNVPTLIPVNYPWVAAYVNVDGVNKWVHIFPWLKDTEIKEGYDLHEFMPEGYKNGFQWVKKYLERDPQILGTSQTANYQQGTDTNKLIVIEAEKFYNAADQGGHYWKPVIYSGYSGVGAIQAMPNGSPSVDTGYTMASPRADYKVNFTEAGTYYVWVRGLWPNADDNSIHLGLDGTASSTADRIAQNSTSGSNYTWTRDTADNVIATITVPTAGLHTINLWMREDGVVIDKILLSKSSGYSPPSSSVDPVESPQNLLEDDTPSALYPKFVEAKIKAVKPKLSMDDMGVQIRNRRNNYSRWQDFPMPWEVSEVSASMTQQANLSALASIFDTINVEVFSDRNNNSAWDSGEPRLQTGDLRSVDLHNRRFLLRHAKTGTNAHNMILSLAPFRSSATGTGNFAGGSDLLPRQTLTTGLVAADDHLFWKTTYKRHRSFTGSGQPFLGVSNTLQVDENRPLRKGDTAALCLNYGRVTQAMLNVHAEEFWAAQKAFKDSPDSGGDVEVFQGTTMYLMGLGYFERVSDFNTKLSGWHKQNTVSFFAHGFAKLSPRRNPDGTLPNNGDLDLIYPNVDMSFRVMAHAGNGTLRPDSPVPYLQTVLDYLRLLGTEVSAQEHRSINRYLNQSNAASSIRLLHLAQQQGYSMLELTKDTYVAKGEVDYTSGGQTKKLKLWDPSLWAQVVNAFTSWDRDYVAVYITPGPIWAADGAYRGLGGFLVGKDKIAALISGHIAPLNGAYGGGLSQSSFELPNYANFSLFSTNSQNYTLTLAPPTVLAPAFVPSTPLWNFSSTINSIASNSYIVTPSYQNSFTAQALFNNALPPSTSSDFSTSFSQIYNKGTSTFASYFGPAKASALGLVTTVADPVHVLTGAFYHDETDLRLNGPMPLEIRRNYDSQNLGDQSFGWGWKLSYQPYLVVSEDQSLISASDMDGSVIYYRRQTGNPNQWLPTSADNPMLINVQGDQMGGLGNVLNAKIDKSTVGSDTVYTLTGADASIRTYIVRAFPAYVGTAAGGLTARYFDTNTLSAQKLLRTDATVNFSYGTGSPDPSIAADTFSVRWTGKVKAPVTGTYTFKTNSDDGVRLWVNGVQLISKWSDLGIFTGTINLTAGQKYDIKLEYKEESGGAAIALSWAYPGQSDQIIPVSALFAENNGLERERPYLAKWQDNRGNYYNFSFGTDLANPDYGQLRRIESSNGNFIGFSYDRFGHITEAYTRDGRRVLYTYDEFGDLVKISRPDASVISYEYKHDSQQVGSKFENYSEHLIIRERKPEGRILENDYDTQKRVTVQRATVGTGLVPIQNASFTYTNSVNGDKTLTGTTVVRDAYNRATSYTYANSLITQITDPNNNSVVQEWYQPNDGSTGAYPRSLKRRVDKRGLDTRFKYDSRGNLVESRVVAGDVNGDGLSNADDIAITTFQYHPTRNVPETVTDPMGNKIVYFYDNPTYPYLPTNIEKRSANNTLTGATAYTYGAQGSVVPFAKGVVTGVTRDAGTSDEASTTMGYNNNGYVTEVTRTTGTSDPSVAIAMVYNLRGELVEKKDAANRKWSYCYDNMGRTTGEEVRNESGQLLSWNYQYYNLNGELEWTDGPRFGPEDYVWSKYDGGGRAVERMVWRSKVKPDGSGVEAPSGDEFYATTFSTYNLFGDLLEVSDAFRNSTVMTYDGIGQILSRKQYQGGSNGTLLTQESYLYEPGGKVKQVTGPLGAVTKTFYTATGQPRRRENPDGSVLGWEYDLSGRPKKETLSNGSYWTIVYDDAARQIIRTFRDSAGAVLATESKSLDRRGNVVSQTDRDNNVFASTYDDLDRVKTTTGPGATASSAQQSTAYVYDNCGKVLKVYNGLNEETETIFDALQRPLSIKVKDSAGTVKSQAAFAYSADHHAVVKTTGTGAGAVSGTIYTDNEGHAVITANGSGQKCLVEYTQSPRRIVRKDELGQPTTTTLDARGLVLIITQPGGASCEMVYDAAGNLLERRMPGNLVHKSVYDTLSRKQSEELKNGSDVSRQFSYTYYTGGNWIGLPQTTIDPRGVSFTTTYDSFLRPAALTASGSQPEHNQSVGYSYDSMGRVLSVAQSFAAGSTGPSTKVIRAYDAYGQVNAEIVEIDGGTVRSFSQKWNAAGRRSELASPDSVLPAPLFSYTWRAGGLLTSVQANNQSYTFNYADNNLLTQRSNPFRTQTITSRDPCGRILDQKSAIGSGTPLAETMVWRANSTLDTYGADKAGTGIWDESREFTYNSRGQLLSESYAASASQNATLNYQFDGGTAGNGVGVRSKALVSGGILVEASNVSSIARITAETTNAEARSYTATGVAMGAGSVNLRVDGVKLAPITFSGFLDNQGNWSAPLKLPPGAHQIQATAQHPSGKFSPVATSSFNVAYQSQTLSSVYDATGNTTSRSFNGGRSQTLKWDAFDRLISVSERNAANDGYDWSAVYDAMGRRLQTKHVLVTGSAPVTASTAQTDSWYDPEVEFLEVGVSYNGEKTWKVYGPDLCGTFGGCQGIGGLEAVIPASGFAVGLIQDYFGNVVASSDGTVTTWNGIRSGGYGPLPGVWSPAMAPGRGAADVTAWRGKRADETGMYYLGARYYEPTGGRFLSPDPMGHGASMSLYDYAGGDPVNFVDPDGRLRSGFSAGWNDTSFGGPNALSSAFVLGSIVGGAQAGWWQGATQLILGEYSNQAQSWDSAAGQVGLGLSPLGTIADIRDWSAAGYKLSQGTGSGADFGIATLGLIPGVSELRRTANVADAGLDTYKASNNLVQTLPRQSDQIAGGLYSDASKAGGNFVYRALNETDAARLQNGLGLQAKNPSGGWSFEDHIRYGSSKASWSNDPFISTTLDETVARNFNEAGSGHGVVRIDLDAINGTAIKAFEQFPDFTPRGSVYRGAGFDALPYQYSVWQQEISIMGEIPASAIKLLP